MSEFRQDIVTKEWVLVAPNRSGRPHEFPRDAATPGDLPVVAPACVFCPGSEKQTPASLARYPKLGDWQIRVVPNKFGLLELGEGSPQRNFYVRLPGVGSHEVVITRPHNQPTALQELPLIDQTLGVYVDRLNELAEHEAVRYVHIIQNHGKLAGASLAHPHSQIFAMPFLGPHIQEEIRGSYHHYALFDQCIYCEIIRHERSVGARIVIETEHFITVCPFESKMPYQLRIMPKRHQASFAQISISERTELALVLKTSLGKLYNKLGNPSYNYYIHTAPFERSKNSASSELSYHWHLVILPRINIWAGLELGTEIYVNIVPPEAAAEYLRSDPTKP